MITDNIVKELIVILDKKSFTFPPSIPQYRRHYLSFIKLLSEACAFN